MTALSAGTLGPDFSLQNLKGETFSLRDALSKGPALIAFFKISCPVCQYTFPFLERIYQAHGSKGLTLVGISQNNKKDTSAFLRQYGVTFPVLLDEAKVYAVSNAYGLTTVPTIFWIARDGEIEISSVGWVRGEIDEIHRRASALSGVSKPIFASEEKIAEFRPG